MLKVFSGVLFCAAIALVVGGELHGQNPGNPPAYTVITLEKMHCDGCAKRIASKAKPMMAFTTRPLSSWPALARTFFRGL